MYLFLFMFSLPHTPLLSPKRSCWDDGRHIRAEHLSKVLSLGPSCGKRTVQTRLCVLRISCMRQNHLCAVVQKRGIHSCATLCCQAIHNSCCCPRVMAEMEQGKPSVPVSKLQRTCRCFDKPPWLWRCWKLDPQSWSSKARFLWKLTHGLPMFSRCLSALDSNWHPARWPVQQQQQQFIQSADFCSVLHSVYIPRCWEQAFYDCAFLVVFKAHEKGEEEGWAAQSFDRATNGIDMP